jgi:hypothetical protein
MTYTFPESRDIVIDPVGNNLEESGVESEMRSDT